MYIYFVRQYASHINRGDVWGLAVSLYNVFVVYGLNFDPSPHINNIHRIYQVGLRHNCAYIQALIVKWLVV